MNAVAKNAWAPVKYSQTQIGGYAGHWRAVLTGPAPPFAGVGTASRILT